MPGNNRGVPCSNECKMGETDKMQTKLQFEAQKKPRSRDRCKEELGAVSEDRESNAEPEQHHILAAMQSSLAMINSKIDPLSYRMYRMTEPLDKQVEQVNEAERKISMVESQTLFYLHLALYVEYCMLYPAKSPGGW
ncbi:hypothetical protein NDU88_004084 [Pleurodeles waltl]|uniref:Uncharacterized protein n=1 Tax=Pleurodeles waltl TaxID=8319 RepID=A0AAV7QB83_PLEWA|nr:hypothetical protein NDU88_004084 [Pleurodeles waltl]